MLDLSFIVMDSELDLTKSDYFHLLLPKNLPFQNLYIDTLSELVYR